MDNKKKCLKKSFINGKHVDDFNCAICHEVYENPRNLQCNHSFCLKCIVSYIRQKFLKEDRLATDFTCPLCRGDINISENRIRHVIYKCKLEEDDVKDIFPKNIALASATDNLNTEQEFCTEHPNKIYEYFCKDHQILCCSKCILKVHRNCQHVIDMDECSHETFGGMLHDSQQQLLASYNVCDQKFVSKQESTRQTAVNSLESLKLDVIDVITKAQETVNEITSVEIENGKKQFGPRPEPVPVGTKCSRRGFVSEIQEISSRMTKFNGSKPADTLGAKLAVPIKNARTSIKRKVGSALLDSCTTTAGKRLHYLKR